MKTVLLSTAYFAPVSYYVQLCKFDHIKIETCCNYIKQTYRNRCNIAGANGVLPLSVPIVKPESLKCHTKDIRISEHGNWRHLHWNAIVSAYGSTPFFEYYRDELQPFFEKKYEFLFDFNEIIRETICSLLDINPNIEYTSHYIDKTEKETDMRDTIHPKKMFPFCDYIFEPKPYYQVFESRYGFIPDLSILDLLFNMGPESVLILHD